MKQIRILLSIFVAALTTFTLSAEEAKVLRIASGSLYLDEVPFKIENVSISNKDVAKLETISEDGRQFRITGLKNGVTDIQLIGGGMSQMYKLTVVDDLSLMFNALKRDLDAVPELDISMNNGKLVLKGELSNIANWELKAKVVQAYGGVILDLSTFRPTPEVLLSLQKNFEKAGFKVVRNGTETNPGEISITQIGEMLSISGNVYGPDDIKVINSILSAQPWLTLDSSNAAKSHYVKAFVNVQILPVMLQIDIIHIALSKSEIEQVGNSIAGLDNFLWGSLNLDGMLSAFKTRGSATAYNNFGEASASGGSMLAGALAFLGNNGVTRARRAGFLTFKSNESNEYRKLQNGGTLYFSSIGIPNGTVVSETTEIEYGLILEVKGGLTGVDTVSIDLKQQLSYPENSAIGGVQVDLKKFQTSNAISCKLGEPIAIGGLKEFVHTNATSDSIPYLRNIPGLKWFISQEKDEFKDDEVLTLICVRKLVPSTEIDQVAVELEKMKQTEDKIMQERKEKVEKRGWWFW